MNMGFRVSNNKIIDGTLDLIKKIINKKEKKLMKRIFAKRFLTVLAFLFAFALLINANVAKANAEETDDEVSSFVTYVQELSPYTGAGWNDSLYSNTAFFEKLQRAVLVYASLSSSQIGTIADSDMAIYNFFVITKDFKSQIDVATKINELTGRVNGVTGFLPINAIDENYVYTVESQYAGLIRTEYTDFASSIAKIEEAKAQVNACKAKNAAAIAAIAAIEYLNGGAMTTVAGNDAPAATYEVVYSSKTTIDAATEAYAEVAVRDQALITNSAKYFAAKEKLDAIEAEIQDVKDQIAELWTATNNGTDKFYTNAAAIVALTADVQALKDAQDAGAGLNNVYDALTVTEKANAETLKTKLAEVNAQIAAVEALIDVLDGIADADVYTKLADRALADSSFAKMKDARNAFNALPVDVKASCVVEGVAVNTGAVNNYADLVAFEAKFQEKIDEITECERIIMVAYNAFIDAETSPENLYLEAKVAAANKAYTDLCASQKADVTKLTELENVRAQGSALTAAGNELDAKILKLYNLLGECGIGNTVYSQLDGLKYNVYLANVEREYAENFDTPSKQAYVKEHAKLVEVRRTIDERNSALSAWLEKVAAAVDAGAAVEVVYGENGNYEAVLSAEAQWALLNAESKAAAQDAYSTSYNYYVAMVADKDAKVAAAEAAKAAMAAIQAIETAVPSLANSTDALTQLAAYKAAYEAAKAAYDALGSFKQYVNDKYAAEVTAFEGDKKADYEQAKVEYAIVDALKDGAGSYKAQLVFADAPVIAAIVVPDGVVARNVEDDNDDTVINTLAEAKDAIAEITAYLDEFKEAVADLVEESEVAFGEDTLTVVDLTATGKLAQLVDQYNAFSVDEKAVLTNEKDALDDLYDAALAEADALEVRIQDVLAASPLTAQVIAEMQAIKAVYDTLHPSQQALVLNYSDFESAYRVIVVVNAFEAAVNKLDAELDVQSTPEAKTLINVLQVIYTIYDLGSVISPEVNAKYLALEGKYAANEEITVKELQDLINELEDKDSELSGLINTTKTELEGKIAELKTELEGKINAAKAELEAKITALQALVDAAATADQLTAAKAELQAKLDEVAAAYAAADEAIKDLLENKFVDAKNAAADRSNEIEAKLNEQVALLEGKIAAAQAAASSELSAAKTALETAFAAADEAVKAELEGKVTAAKADLEAKLAAQKAELETKIAAAQAAAQAAQTTADAAATKAELQAAQAALEAAFAAADEAVKAEVATAKEVAASDLAAAKAELEEKIAALEEKVDSIENKLEQQQEQLNQLANQLNSKAGIWFVWLVLVLAVAGCVAVFVLKK